MQANALPDRVHDDAQVHDGRHRPEPTTLHRLVQQHAQTFFALAEETTGASLPQCLKDGLDTFLECGILAHGVLRLRCGDCGHHTLLAFSCKLPCRAMPRSRKSFVPTGRVSAEALAPRLGVRHAKGPVRALVSGLTLQAAVRSVADDRQAPVQRCRYIPRPALATGCVPCNASGQVVPKLQTAWRDGISHIVPVATGLHRGDRVPGVCSRGACASDAEAAPPAIARRAGNWARCPAGLIRSVHGPACT